MSSSTDGEASRHIFEATCASFTQGFPYYPFIKIVRDYCEIGDDDDETRIREKARRK